MWRCTLRFFGDVSVLSIDRAYDMWQSFGAFVDVGAERDGFIHVSDISTEFIHQPSDFLRSGDLTLRSWRAITRMTHASRLCRKAN